MNKVYTTNNLKIIAFPLIIISIICIISIIYMILSRFDGESQSTSFVLILSSVLTVLYLYIYPKSDLSVVTCWNLTIEINDECIRYLKHGKMKTHLWEEVCEIEYHRYFLFPDKRLIIWDENNDNVDEAIAIPAFMKNSKQLYREIYENVKEKSPNAKMDKRFIKYVKEKC